MSNNKIPALLQPAKDQSFTAVRERWLECVVKDLDRAVKEFGIIFVVDRMGEGTWDQFYDYFNQSDRPTGN